MREFPWPGITCMLRALIRGYRPTSKQLLVTCKRRMSFSVEERGSPNTLDFRLFYSELRCVYFGEH